LKKFSIFPTAYNNFRMSAKIAPVIHEWTYDAMCHDLLEMDGQKYIYEVTKAGSEPERKEALLEDHDPLWVELRHIHIADASERLYDKMNNFVSKNKAAQLHSRDGGEISTKDLQKIVQALPQYGEQVEKLTLHIEVDDYFHSISCACFMLFCLPLQISSGFLGTIK
jgi:syntaxin-binding protein 1